MLFGIRAAMPLYGDDVRLKKAREEAAVTHDPSQLQSARTHAHTYTPHGRPAAVEANESSLKQMVQQAQVLHA